MDMAALCHELRECESVGRLFALYKCNEQLRPDRGRFCDLSLCATTCVRPMTPAPCEMRHCFSQSSDRPREGPYLIRPPLSALEAIFGKGFIGSAGMKRGTGHRFRDFHAKTP
jgi:hypothetical protein